MPSELTKSQTPHGMTTNFISFHQTFVVLVLLFVNIYEVHSNFGGKCRESEQTALLKFKAGLIDESGRLSSWDGSTNCCEWRGVECDNRTNHVVALDLPRRLDEYPNAPLRGKISPSLLQLPHLQYLDLSLNDFNGTAIPNFIGLLSKLQHLDLSSNSFDGNIPDFLVNLTSLSYLDLAGNQLQGEFPQPSRNSSSLTHLDLSSNKLNGQLPRLLAWLPDSTRYLYLSANVFCGSFPNMSRFSVLKELDLGGNLLNGTLLEDNLRLPNLEYLGLSRNKFTGRLPNLSSCPSLSVLQLDRNSFNGSLTESFGNHSKIEDLSVGFNQLEGLITESHLSSLPQLRNLDLTSNLNITIRINRSWMHPLQFYQLYLANCNLGPYFPEWLQKQNQLEFLDISNSGIVDSIPSWFWGNIHECRFLNMSQNQIYGVLPDLSSKFKELWSIDLSFNEFTGSLPSMRLVDTVGEIFLSNNKFSGTLLNFCNYKDGKQSIIDLSNNLLSGEISQDCFLNLLSTVEHLNLANNNFSGDIPTTKNFSCRVLSLHLRNNSFRGEISRSLMNCSEMIILDLGENEFIGKIPAWLGESMPELMVLILKSNMLYGSLPSSICHLANLQVMDISLNKIAGTIPKCVIKFTQLRKIDSQYYPFLGFRISSLEYFYGSASVIWKGNEETYKKNLGLLKMIDLSSNELTGEIPQELTSLIGLLGLNLSRNNLVGFIPHDIDQLNLLNFLDLSRNGLSGSIPLTLSKMSHLGILDLSFNNLSDRIPWDTHLQTFGASTYLGNPRLCGPPLEWRPCREDEKPSNGRDIDSEDEDDNLITRGFYISMLLGFFVAFWVVFWTLFFNKWWNVITIKIYIAVSDWMYVTILVNQRRLLRYFGNA